MNKYRLFFLVFLVFAFIFFAIGLFTGEVEAGIFVVFPFLKGSGLFAFLGFIFLFLTFLTFIFSFSLDFKKDIGESLDNSKSFDDKKSNTEGGGVVFIGPIPIVFGSNWKVAVVLIILAIVIMLVAFFVL